MSKEDGELSDGSPNMENEDFVIDRTFSGIIPNDELEEAETPPTEKSSGWQKRMRKRLLGEPEEEEPQNKRRRGNCCFNCRGDHSIAQCPEPRDPAAIRRNKAEFQSGQQASSGRISKAVESSTVKFAPGKVSQALRAALNLGPDDIPEWIYRMRRMGFHKGYPPGHLKNALKWECENIKIFSDDQPKEEDHDVGRPAPALKKEKVIYFIGFNKTYGALRDQERGRFQVPPFDVFCDILQKEITIEHNESEKLRVFEDKVRRHQLLLKKEAEEPKEEKEANPDEELFVIDKSKSEEPVEAASITPIKSAESNVGLGESVSHLVGTPVISRRDPSGQWQEESLPSLEAFSVGIVPFEAKEEAQKTGTFRKIMETLRRADQ